MSTAELDSPCIRKCCLDNNDICMGCYRSLAEITQWTLVDKITRQSFINNAAARKKLNKRLYEQNNLSY